jgi:hypothetical protein
LRANGKKIQSYLLPRHISISAQACEKLLIELLRVYISGLKTTFISLCVFLFSWMTSCKKQTTKKIRTGPRPQYLRQALMYLTKISCSSKVFISARSLLWSRHCCRASSHPSALYQTNYQIICTVKKYCTFVSSLTILGPCVLVRRK